MAHVQRLGYGPPGTSHRTYTVCVLEDGSEWCIPSLCTGPNAPKCGNDTELRAKLAAAGLAAGGGGLEGLTRTVPVASLAPHLTYSEAKDLHLKPRGVYLLSMPALLEVLRRTPVVKKLWCLPHNAFDTIAGFKAVLAEVLGGLPAGAHPPDPHVWSFGRVWVVDGWPLDMSCGWTVSRNI